MTPPDTAFRAIGTTTPALDRFRTLYAPRDPARPSRPHESVVVEPEHGLAFLQEAPASDVEYGYPPRDTDDRGENTYLWVIDNRGVPYLIDRPMTILEGNEPKHTNLTAGKPAYIGGALWFSCAKSIYVSGGSGRFPPLDEAHLTVAIDVFKSFLYNVTSLGWNPETGRARRGLQEFE